MLELGHQDRKRIFNLGYYTWVEQQGVRFDDFEERKDQSFWRGLVDTIPAWDRLIESFNAEAGVTQNSARKSATAERSCGQALSAASRGTVAARQEPARESRLA